MSESQLIEYKESWRDEYLKWICASFACQNSFSKTRSGLRRFANAQGGVLYTVKKILSEMQTEGYIRRVGADKGGYWEIVK